ncbi:MAG: TetR/AcrR family transcriptional regulator [Luteibaculaceae bacterium]
MGVQERKAKEKEELKALILKAANKLFVTKGVEQTTIRNIAKEIEYSVGTVYVYYKDKNDILHELHTQGFKQLGGEMRVLFSVSDPMERLKALGRVYLKFSHENPDMYDLMFSMKAPMEFIESSHKEEWNEGKATFDVLKQTVFQCLENGHFKGHTLEPLSFLIWSVVHGMATLNNSQRVKGVSIDNPETIMDNAYNEFVLMIDKI